MCASLQQKIVLTVQVHLLFYSSISLTNTTHHTYKKNERIYNIIYFIPFYPQQKKTKKNTINCECRINVQNVSRRRNHLDEWEKHPMTSIGHGHTPRMHSTRKFEIQVHRGSKLAAAVFRRYLDF